MKKFLKKFVLLILMLIAVIVGYYLHVTNFVKGDILSNGPRKPQYEIPVTYNIGWWPNQKTFYIDSLRIKVIESKLSLINNKSLVAYKVNGHINNVEHLELYVGEVHISERINYDTTQNFDRLIEITPAIEEREGKDIKGGSDKFDFENEHIIISNHWGLNRIKFICGQKQQIIELQQYK